MIKELFILILVSILPFIELRFSIPLGILSGSVNLPFGLVLTGFSLSPLLVFLIAVVTDVLLGIFLFNLFTYINYLFKKHNLTKRYSKILEKNRKKVKKYVDKYGTVGLILFIAIPLPGSGVYAGTLGAFMIGMKKEKVYIANMIGVIIAASIVTIISILGAKIF